MTEPNDLEKASYRVWLTCQNCKSSKLAQIKRGVSIWEYQGECPYCGCKAWSFDRRYEQSKTAALIETIGR